MDAAFFRRLTAEVEGGTDVTSWELCLRSRHIFSERIEGEMTSHSQQICICHVGDAASIFPLR